MRFSLGTGDKGMRKIAREMGVGVSVVQRVAAAQKYGANDRYEVDSNSKIVVWEIRGGPSSKGGVSAYRGALS